MPVHDLAAARAWIASHSKEGVGHKSRSASVVDSARALTAGPRRPREAVVTSHDDPSGTLARNREIEHRSYTLIDEALKKAAQSKSADDYATLPGLIRSYNQAAVNALAAESAWERHQRATGEVAPVEHLRNVLQSRLEPLAAQLRNFAALTAPKANPSSPAVAESAISSALETILRQIVAALAPIPPPPT